MRMRMAKIAFVLALWCAPVFAANSVYISHAGAGTQDGSSCTNAKPYSYFNSSANWNSSPSGVQIGPGTTVHACAETYVDATANDTALTAQCSTANGSSGNPITLAFDQGVTNLYDSAYWSGSVGAINLSGCTYFVLNGASNLSIANQTSGGTATNGTGLANSANSYGINSTNCTHCTIEGITVKNIYVNAGSSSSATDANGANTICIGIQTNSTGSTITRNSVSQCKTGIQLGTDPAGDASNVTVSWNTESDQDWCINAGGGDAGDTINPLLIYGNDCSNWTNWQFPTSAFHQDGIILFNVGNSAAGITAYIYNNYFHGDMGVGSPTGFIYCADFATCYLYNNVLSNTGHTIVGLSWLGQSSNLGKNMTVYNQTESGLATDNCFQLNLSGTGTFENIICKGPSGSNDGLFNTYKKCGANLSTSFAPTVATSNYNDWVSMTTACGSQADGSTSSYTTWQGLGFEANSTTADPNLSAAFLIQNTSSSAYHTGVNLTSQCTGNLAALCQSAPQTFGVNGSCGTGCVPRPASGAWDMGAYEFAPPTVDMGTPFPALDRHLSQQQFQCGVDGLPSCPGVNQPYP
jgi:hypothetical protein